MTKLSQTYFAIFPAGGHQLLISAAACLHSNWFFWVCQVFADVVAVSSTHKYGWSIFELFVERFFRVVRVKLPWAKERLSVELLKLI